DGFALWEGLHDIAKITAIFTPHCGEIAAGVEGKGRGVENEGVFQGNVIVEQCRATARKSECQDHGHEEGRAKQAHGPTSHPDFLCRQTVHRVDYSFTRITCIASVWMAPLAPSPSIVTMGC